MKQQQRKTFAKPLGLTIGLLGTLLSERYVSRLYNEEQFSLRDIFFRQFSGEEKGVGRRWRPSWESGR
jgi:hypothetical protein